MSFSFVQITDHHLNEAEDQLTHGFSTAFALRATLRSIAETVGQRIDFIISTGDFVQPTTDRAYQNLCQILGLQIQSPAPGPHRIHTEGLQGMPMYFLPGNHDDRPIYFRNLFPDQPPQETAYAVFHHQGVQFVCLDWGDQAQTILSPGMLDFLSAALENGKPSVLLMHHHVVLPGIRWLDNFVTEDVDRFWEVVARFPNVLGVFCGHAHTTYEQIIEGVPVYGLRSTAFSFAPTDHPLLTLQPPHYRLVTISDGVLTTRVYEVNL